MLKKNIIIFMSFASILIGRSEPKNTFSESHLNEIDLEINKAIKESKIPGAVLWIEKDNNLYHQKYGKKCLTPAPKSMEKDTIFDAASLTKVMATAPSIMILVEEGKLSINDPVTKHPVSYTHLTLPTKA